MSASEIIEKRVIAFRGDQAQLSERAYELWRWHWLMQELPVRPTSSTPTRSFIGNWRG
jgi:hypothetical protein